MEKREFWRVSTNFPVDFRWGSHIHEGVVTNFSGNGMYIESGIRSASGLDLEVVLIAGDEVFKLSGKVKRTENTSGSGTGMGIELLCPPLSYRNFVCTVKANVYKELCESPSLEVSKRICEKVAS